MSNNELLPKEMEPELKKIWERFGQEFADYVHQHTEAELMGWDMRLCVTFRSTWKEEKIGCYLDGGFKKDFKKEK